MIIVAKIIHNNNIIAISKEILLKKKRYQSNSSLTLFIVCFVSFLANELRLKHECGEVRRWSVTVTVQKA